MEKNQVTVSQVYEITTLPLVGEFFDWWGGPEKKKQRGGATGGGRSRRDVRLYDWFSEYRLRAAGREDILEKAVVDRHKIIWVIFRIEKS